MYKYILLLDIKVTFISNNKKKFLRWNGWCNGCNGFKKIMFKTKYEIYIHICIYDLANITFRKGNYIHRDLVINTGDSPFWGGKLLCRDYFDCLYVCMSFGFQSLSKHL